MLITFKQIPKPIKGPSFWKMNNSLLDDNNYVNKMHSMIRDYKSSLDEHLNPNSIWELLKYEIRKETIAYSKAKAKKTRNV